MENCIKRNESTIISEFEINGKSIEIEQRLLTDQEVDEYKKNHVDITQDPEVFKALVMSERVEEGQDVEIETLYKLQAATKSINDAKKDLEYWLINKSLTSNVFYGGYMKIDGENIEAPLEYIKLLDSGIIETLLENAESLSFPTEVEVEEAKQ